MESHRLTIYAGLSELVPSQMKGFTMRNGTKIVLTVGILGLLTGCTSTEFAAALSGFSEGVAEGTARAYGSPPPNVYSSAPARKTATTQSASSSSSSTTAPSQNSDKKCERDPNGPKGQVCEI